MGVMDVRAPQTQKAEARPISFVLDDQSTGAAPVSVSLVIRPEDLTRNDRSRVAVQQTLGGAWADNFGPGVPSITIAGHTGWRRRLVGDDERDGGERFVQLFKHVFTDWHTLRKDAIKNGRDPDLVRMVFADALDGFAALVSIDSFVLRRSKQRPLLSQYQIALTVLSDDIDQLAYLEFGSGNLDKQALEAAGLDSLTASINELIAYERDIQDYVDRTLVVPVRDFLGKTARLYQAVSTAISTGDEIAGSMIAVGRMTAAAGINIFRSINAVAEVPSIVRSRMMEVAGAYSNVFCVLRNAVQQQEFYPDYNPLFGSANCSSTSGGRPLSPLSGVNPFYLYSPNNRELPVQVTENAQVTLETLASADVVLAPPSQASLLGSLSQISNGLAIA
jgi:hypothetical protein